MKITLNKTVDLKLLLDAIKLITTVNEDNLSFETFRIYELKSILQSYINFPENISNISRSSIVTNSINRIARVNFNPNEFEFILNDELKKHFNITKQDYFLLVSISVNTLPFRKIKVNNSEIIIKGKSFPKLFNQNRIKLLEKKHLHEENEKFLKVIVKTESHNFTDAFKESLKNLDVLRSILNLNLNSNLEINFGTDIKPINKIRYGKYLTMHFGNGKTVNEFSYWWEPNFQNKIYNLEKEKYEILKKNTKWYLNRINKSNEKFKKNIIYTLNLYVNAFDEPNKQNCFLKVWTALETLLATHQNDLIIKRCVSIYKEEHRPMQRQIIGAIKNYRNEFVHEGIEASRENLSTYCFKIQNIIEGILIHNHLRYYSSFDNIEQANTFLDKRRIGLKEQKKEMEMLKIIRNKINTKS